MRPADYASESSRATMPPRPWYEVLRALRQARGSTQEGWAARLGVSRKTVQRWDSGERAPDPGAERAILTYCREADLLRSFDRGPLAGLTVSEAGLRDLFSEARWQGAARQAPVQPPDAARAARGPAQLTNLPVQLTSFVGREREIAIVRRVQAETRLLTLTGPGGCGKTRLAQALAEELLWAYPHGVWFVNLAPLTDAALVPQAVASALMIRETGQQPLTLALSELLSSRTLLIVLDNCEHLLPACAELVETLLRSCQQLEVMATSREPLGVAGETIWRVPPMTVPSRAPRVPLSGSGSAEPEAADSVELFIRRARLQRPELDLTLDDALVVAEICCNLDGMPLAIELAAARVNVLSVRQIAERLHDRFHLLTGGGRTVLPRHQTLRATMDWSHDLLSAPERALLRALSVFAGGFTLAAAEAVYNGASDEGHSSGIVAADVLDLLTHLVDKSLVSADDQRGVVRYRMLQTVRQYAEEKLVETGELAGAHARHAAWCLTLAEAAKAELYGPREVEWLAQLEQEHDNLRAALGWSLVQSRQDHETALRLAGALPRFWELRGHLGEGRRWLSQALEMAGDAPAAGRARALCGAGTLAYMQGEFAASQALFAQSLVLYREIGDRYGIAETQGDLGRAALRRGDFTAARAFLDASLALSAELGPTPGIANVQFTIGVIALRQGDYAEAEARFRASLGLNRQLGNREGIANALEELATVLDEQGLDGEQGTLLVESLALYRELGDRGGIAAVLGHLGMEAWACGDHHRALTLLQEGRSLYRDVGDRRGIARLLGNESLVAYSQGDYARAAALCRESLALNLGAGDTWAIGRYLPVLAGVAFARGQPERATRLFGAATAIRERLGALLPPVVRSGHAAAIAAVRTTLGERSFAEAWVAGQVMSVEEFIERECSGERDG